MKFADRGAAGRQLAAKLAHLKDQAAGGLGIAARRCRRRFRDCPGARRTARHRARAQDRGTLATRARSRRRHRRGQPGDLHRPRIWPKPWTYRKAMCRKRRHASSRRSNGAGRATARAARHSKSPGAPRSSSMTASPRVRRCGWRCGRCGGAIRAHLVLAVPVAPPETLAEFRKEADEAVCLETPAMLGAIGFYYRDFHQMSDAEVTDLLARAAAADAGGVDPSECSSG